MLASSSKIALRKSTIGLALAVLVAVTGVEISQAATAAETAEATMDNKGTWHGFDRYDFVMDEATVAITPFKAPAAEGDGIKEPAKDQRRCVLVVPKEEAPGHPWSWRGCYWNHEPQTEIELLKHGFCIAYTSANATLKCVFPTPGGPRKITLLASCTKRSERSSRICRSSIEGWNPKSN